MNSPAQKPTTASKLSTYLSQLNPVPAFPSYSGPHKVGTVDVEIPVAELDSPSPAPDNAKDIHTVQFRIYYPTTPDANGSRISWLPAPQRNHVAAYTQFLGLRPLLADIISCVCPDTFGYLIFQFSLLPLARRTIRCPE